MDPRRDPEQHNVYGHFPGGDPRHFSPDPECSTGSERQAHREACQWAEDRDAAGEDPRVETSALYLSGEGWASMGHRGMFGLGTYYAEGGDD